jgi:hypothetical protein
MLTVCQIGDLAACKIKDFYVTTTYRFEVFHANIQEGEFSRKTE